MRAEDLYEAMQSIRPEFLEESEMQSKKKKLPRRALLIAAAVAAVGIVGAAAVSWSLRSAARADIGMETPLPGWTEYEVEGEVETVPEAEPRPAEPQPPKPERVEHEWRPELWQDTVTLDSVFCSGDMVVAFLRVGGISPEVAACLAMGPRESMETGGEPYQWDIGGIDIPLDQLDQDHNVDLGPMTHVSYDEATETALVRVEFKNVRGLKEIPYSLSLINGLEQVANYETVVIPVTPSEGLQTAVDFTLPREDYRGDMRAVSASVYASYVEVEFTFTPFSEIAEPDELGEGEDIYHPDGSVENHARQARRDFLESLFKRTEEALDDAELIDREGNSIKITELDSAYSHPYSNGWISSTNSFPKEFWDGGKYACRYEPTQAIDLSRIASITIGGVNYPLS